MSLWWMDYYIEVSNFDMLPNSSLERLGNALMSPFTIVDSVGWSKSVYFLTSAANDCSIYSTSIDLA